MRRYVTEFTGTFFLVLTIGLSVAESPATAPIAIGAVLVALVYMGGHVSGAHYNPAASLGFLLLGRMRRGEMVIYWIIQVAGALAAALVVATIAGVTFAPAPANGHGAAAALGAEFLFTFLLVLVIANVAMSRGTSGNGYYGIAIGFTVAAGAFAVGPVSGAAFNPAVGIGLTLVDAALNGGGLGALWIYLLGPLAGAAVAAAVFRLQERPA